MVWAVHISDGILSAPWWLGGYAAAAALLVVSAWRVRDEEIPRISLLTAAFFIISVVHVRVGFTSVHLLMNGLVGIVLGPRATLALFCGLFLQYWLINHGGQQTLGINTCILAVPALLAWVAFHACQRLPWLVHPGVRWALVMASIAVWLGSLVFSVSLLWDHGFVLASDSVRQSTDLAWTQAIESAWTRVCRPDMLLVTFALAALAAWGERRLENAPEFPLGLLLGELSVLMSVGLNCAVLVLGGEDAYSVVPLVLLVAHLPIAVLEGIILGFTLGFLAKVKPELLGIVAPQPR